MRSRKPDSGMLRPRVQASVSRLSSAWWWHLALERVLDCAIKAARVDAPAGGKRLADVRENS
jgi:hypothetical protein